MTVMKSSEQIESLENMKSSERMESPEGMKSLEGMKSSESMKRMESLESMKSLEQRESPERAPAERSGPLVSVVLPVYNGQRFIRSAIQSVLTQTYARFELLVVDDGSQDASVREFEAFGDRRLRLLRHPVNEGFCAACNTGQAAASGTYITFLDHDDMWEPGRLDFMVRAIGEAGDGYFVSDDLLDFFEPPQGLRFWLREQRDRFHIAIPGGGCRDLDLITYLKAGAPTLKPLIPLAHVRRHGLAFEPRNIYRGDFEYFCHLFRTGLRLRLLGEAFYLWRMTPGSLSKVSNALACGIGVLKRMLREEGFSAGERQLLAIMLRRDERYAPLQEVLRKKDLPGALRVALTRPGAALELLRRCGKSLQYRLAARRLGGFWG